MRNDDGDGSEGGLNRDEVSGGRRRLRRLIVLVVVLGMTLAAFGVVTMIR